LKNLFAISLVFFLNCQHSYADSQVSKIQNYSEDWAQEASPSSYLFFVYDHSALTNTHFDDAHYHVVINSSVSSLFGVNYFARLTSAPDAKANSFNLWLHTSVEAGSLGTSLIQNDSISNVSAINGQLLTGRLGAGPMLSYDLNSYIRPFIATEIWGYAYRTSNADVVDFSGQGFILEPMVGIESKVFSSIHAMLQLGYNHSLTNSLGSLFNNNTSVSFGLGATL